MIRVFSSTIMVVITCLPIIDQHYTHQGYTKDNYIYSLINDNIDIFNEESKDGTKPKTNYSQVSDWYNIISPYDNNEIGTLLIFDNDAGYISITKDNCILDSNYTNGINLIGNKSPSKNIYYLAHAYSFDKNNLIGKINCRGGDDYYHWHSDYEWANEKPRNLLHDFDNSYSSLTNTSETTFKNKITWSTYQGNNGYCGAFALANLFWTYKIHNVVDLSSGAITSTNLAYLITNYVPSGAYYYEMLNVNDTILNNTGYRMEYASTVLLENVLETGPAIALFNPPNTSGHYALVTGRGKSLYQTIMWINFYTTWDVINTWYDRTDTNNGYLSCKYWIDNQYATYAYALKNSLDHIVTL